MTQKQHTDEILTTLRGIGIGVMVASVWNKPSLVIGLVIGALIMAFEFTIRILIAWAAKKAHRKPGSENSN
jgi:hypothetical protein